MIPCVKDYRARVAGVREGVVFQWQVVAFDDQGFALVVDNDKGCLVRAAEFPGFISVLSVDDTELV